MLSRFVLLVFLAGPVAAQPASDLLQSGIFAQETSGDLDTAIRIYRQILAAGVEMHVYAAQAQYRLGVCLLRKGDSAAALKAFQSVIHDYPEERDLAARAREGMSQTGNLLPAPWSDTEVAEYRWSIPRAASAPLAPAPTPTPFAKPAQRVDDNSSFDGWSLTRIVPAGSGTLRIQIGFYSPMPYTTMVDVERTEMRPLRVSYRSPSQRNLGGAKARRGNTGAYEYGEVLYLLRRMPLYEGWTAAIPVLAPDGTRADLDASVAGVETVTVPAGTFRCFKVSLANGPPGYVAAGTDWQPSGAPQLLWYAVEGARALVRVQVAGYSGELTSLRTAEPSGTTSYHDPVVGFSFTVPSAWVFHARGGFSGPATSVDLLDPELQVFATISFKSKMTAPENIQDELLTGALIEQQQRPNLATRGALEQGHIAEHASIAWVGERTGPEGQIVRWTTWIQSESTRGSIAVAVPADQFEQFRARFQPILDSFRMP